MRPSFCCPSLHACSAVSDSLWHHGLWPAKLLCLWDIPGKNTGVGCHFLLQGIFLTQGLNLYFLHWQTDSLLMSHLGSPLGVLHHGNFPSFIHPSVQFSAVQSLSRVWLFATPGIAARQASLSITISRSSPKLMSIESVIPSNHLILHHPRLLLPPIPPSIRDFSNEPTLHIRWPKYWSFNFNISPSSEYSGLISFRMDWLDLLAVQRTLKSFLQHHNSKASILQCSASL